jgi:hypothetical protein
MAQLIDFTTPYKGGIAYYTGSGVTGLVPDVFPVAIAGHPYMLDLKSNQFGRAFEPRLRDTSDDSNIPGEAALNSQGLWRRSQVSWHKGAGQRYADTADGIDTRFYKSKNVDPWTRGRLSLLKRTTNVLSSAGTKLPMVVVGSYLYVGDGNTLKFTSDPYASTVSWTSVTTGAPASAAVETLATDGTKVYVSYNNNGIYSSTAGSSSVSLMYPSSGSAAYTFNAMNYVKGRLLTAHDNEIHTALTGTHTEYYAHVNTGFKWVGFAAGQGAIYAAGYAGKTSIIYKITIKADATLDVPLPAGELPLGEVVTSITGYLGYILLGTSRGVRLCTSDDANNLLIGPVLESTTDVKCGVGSGKYIWYGWTNFDGTSTGLGRVDLSELNGVNQPAYASDLMCDVQGAVLSVVNWGDYKIYSVSGHGVYTEHQTNLADTGYIEMGTWRWGIPDRKYGAFVDITTAPMEGQLLFSYKYDNGPYRNLAVFDVQTKTEGSRDAGADAFNEAAFKITFTKSEASLSAGPVLTRWQMRAYAAPKRSELFSVPVLLHSKIRRFERDYHMDVPWELNYLRDLVKNSNITTYQEGKETFKVLVENVQWVPADSSFVPYEYDGTAVVTLRSLSA